VDGPGFFYPPTVLSKVDPASRILQEEAFGPVAPIVPVDDEDDMVAMANDTPYGLAAYVFSKDLAHALHVADRLETGLVGINTGLVSNASAPFGGLKESGIGREGGQEGIDEFLEVKLTTIPTW
jgi:succinate-semialdehyde dehydrogenase/glutarate-semialdehyde dehydrogenase